MDHAPHPHQPTDPLARAFWVGLVLPRAVILTGLAVVSAWLALPLIFAGSVLLADLIYFLWQIRRFQHAADDHVSGLGSLAPVWAGYLAIVLFGALSASLWWGILLNRGGGEPAELFTERMDRLHAAQYNLTPSQDGTILRFNGTITFGLTKHATALAARMPRLNTVILSSDGGHIYEARGFANLIRERGVATQASGDCSSACTLVFIAGTERSLAKGARLGFHQYTLEFDHGVLNVDLQKEQEKDMRFFRQQGVAGTFLARMYEQPSTGLWYPDPKDLRAGGVLLGN